MGIELKKARLEKAYIQDRPFLILPDTEVKKGSMVWKYDITTGNFSRTQFVLDEIEMLETPSEAEKALVLDLLLAENLLWVEDEGIQAIETEDENELDEITYKKADELPNKGLKQKKKGTAMNDVLELFEYDFDESKQSKCIISFRDGKIRFNANAMLKLEIDEKKTVRFLHDKLEKNIYIQINPATSADKTIIGNLFYSKKSTNHFLSKFGAKISFEIAQKVESTAGTAYKLEKI